MKEVARIAQKLDENFERLNSAEVKAMKCVRNHFTIMNNKDMYKLNFLRGISDVGSEL